MSHSLARLSSTNFYAIARMSVVSARKGQTAHFYFVLDGKVCEGQVNRGTPVDTSTVKGQTRTVPAHKKATGATPPAQ